MKKRNLIGLVIFVSLVIGAVTGGYLYFMIGFNDEKTDVQRNEDDRASFSKTFTLKMYYPINDRLQVEERTVSGLTADYSVADATIREYLKGPADPVLSFMPRHAKLNGAYKGTDSILYVDISDEFRRNFQGDVIAEFLLLKGLYKSIVSNVGDIIDVKVLIDGKEIESLGGHLFLLYPLRNVVSKYFPET
jgi:hypothetical protein